MYSPTFSTRTESSSRTTSSTTKTPPLEMGLNKLNNNRNNGSNNNVSDATNMEHLYLMPVTDIHGLMTDKDDISFGYIQNVQKVPSPRTSTTTPTNFKFSLENKLKQKQSK